MPKPAWNRRFHFRIHLFKEVRCDRLIMNDIGTCVLRLTEDLYFDRYDEIRETGSFIMIDEKTHQTVAAAKIIEADNGQSTKHSEHLDRSEFERDVHGLVRKYFPHWLEHEGNGS